MRQVGVFHVFLPSFLICPAQQVRNPGSATQPPTDMKTDKIKTKRIAWICRYCECVYADTPVSQCDCMGAHGKKGSQHFVKGRIEYLWPKPRV